MLRSGETLGPYRIEREIGRGGMGVVFLAHDTRLHRAAAIKALPAEVSGDADRLARFEREARTLASLNHPNIATIYGIEHSGAGRFLALEYVEGESLADRLSRGPIPPREVMELALQLATGIEAAHESGVIHRDLKPGNVMLAADGRVKILDFGLAKGGAGEGTGSFVSGADSPTQAARLSQSPTLASPATLPGVILGTAAYLSPEQARGKPVDRRTDIWAFGCILYECLTGRPPFEGETVSDVIARILEREPVLSSLPSGTPAALRRLVERCLRKDPRERLRDIGDARLALADMLAGRDVDAPVVAPARRRSMPHSLLVMVVFSVAALAYAGLMMFRPAPAERPLRRFAIAPSQFTAGYGSSPRISHDGRRIVYSSRSRLFVRDLATFNSVEVPGSERASSPFWSPDGNQLGFARDEKLWIAATAGAQPALLCAIPGSGGCNGAWWTRDGGIVFCTYRGALYEVPVRGGQPRELLAPDSTEVDFHYPSVLPGERQILFVSHKKSGPLFVSVVRRDGSRRRDLKGYDGLETVVYSPTGHLLLNLDIGRKHILGVPFSASRLEITGEPFTVAAGGQYPSLSEEGTLTYYMGGSASRRELVWLDRAGRLLDVVGQAQNGLDQPAISPDGRRAVLVAYSGDHADLWVQDLVRGTRTRLTSDDQDEYSGTWTGGGTTILYNRENNVGADILEVPADGSAPPRVIGQGLWPQATPDRRTLVFSRDLKGRGKLFRSSPGEPSEAVLLTPDERTSEDSPALSPDGHWLAYWSDESGVGDVFVRRFPEGTLKTQVSLDGGEYPFWSPSGSTLYYWKSGDLVEVPIQTGTSLTLGTARTMFSAASSGVDVSSGFGPPPLTVAADGRFLAVRRSPDDPTNGVLVVENWFEEFRKR